MKGLNLLLTVFFLAKLVVIILVFLAAEYFTPYLTTTDLWLLNGSEPSPSSATPLHTIDGLIRKYLAPLARWDSIYFLTIARDGYNFEQQHAFFPLYPFLMRWLASLLTRLGHISLEAALLASGVLLSNFSHLLFVLNIYHLTQKLGGNERFATTSAIMAAISPSLAFHSAIYSESLFGLLASTGLLLFLYRWRFLASIIWFVAGLTRSNGVLLAGFFLYDALCHFSSKRSLVRDMIGALVTVSSYFVFNYYGSLLYCIQADSRPWCASLLPDLYGFVQKHYWNTGFLRYYCWQQLPNFAIALPTLTASIYMCWSYAQADRRRFLTLGLAKGKALTKRSSTEDFFGRAALLPHAYLMLFMILYTLLFVHVQIVTRLFAFQPFFYWGLAHIFCKSLPFTRRLLVTYLLGYAMIGTLLFTNSYPPA